MPERTEVEKYVRWLIALDIISKPLSSLGDKGMRREKKTVKNIVALLEKESEISKRIFAKIEKREEEKARTLREGITQFKKKYPSYGTILEGIIAETRIKKNEYLIYGLNENYKLSEEDYVRVMMDLGFKRREAVSIYPHIIAISERLGKASEQAERRILISK